MTVKIKHNKAHVLYKALEYEDCKRLQMAGNDFFTTGKLFAKS